VTLTAYLAALKALLVKAQLKLEQRQTRVEVFDVITKVSF